MRVRIYGIALFCVGVVFLTPNITGAAVGLGGVSSALGISLIITGLMFMARQPILK